MQKGMLEEVLRKSLSVQSWVYAKRVVLGTYLLSYVEAHAQLVLISVDTLVVFGVKVLRSCLLWLVVPFVHAVVQELRAKGCLACMLVVLVMARFIRILKLVDISLRIANALFFWNHRLSRYISDRMVMKDHGLGLAGRNGGELNWVREQAEVVCFFCLDRRGINLLALKR